MTGRARANCGITVVNAVPAGVGAAIAIDLPVEAEVDLDPAGTGVRVVLESHAGDADPRLAEIACVLTLDRLGLKGTGAVVRTRSDAPVSRGLKTSSAAANAVILATAAAAGRTLESAQVLDLSATAGMEARVSITGAYDDAAASLLGGLCITDNHARQLLSRILVPEDLAAVVHSPSRGLAKSKVPVDLARTLAAPARHLHRLASEGEWLTALTLNGMLWAGLSGRGAAPALALLKAGALAAGVTGTGPATVGIFPRDAAPAGVAALEDFPGDAFVAALTNRGGEAF